MDVGPFVAEERGDDGAEWRDPDLVQVVTGVPEPVVSLRDPADRVPAFSSSCHRQARRISHVAGTPWPAITKSFGSMSRTFLTVVAIF